MCARDCHFVGSHQQRRSPCCNHLKCCELIEKKEKNPQELTTASKPWNFIIVTEIFWSTKDQVLFWNPSGPWLGKLLCSAIFTSLKHVLLIQAVLSHSLTSIKFKLSRKTWKSTLILISSARNKPRYQEFKPHTAQMNAAAYHVQQGWILPLCEGWMLKKGKEWKKMHLLKTLILVRVLQSVYIKKGIFLPQFRQTEFFS